MKTREDILADHPISAFLEKRGVKLVGSGKIRTSNVCASTSHKPHHLCVSIDVDKNVWHCNDCKIGGSVIDWLMMEANMSAKEAMQFLGGDDSGHSSHSSKGPPQGRSRITAIYDYINESRELVYQAVRLEPKSFRQRRPDGKGGWIWNMDGVTRILFNLPDIILSQTVGICYSDDTQILTNEGWVGFPDLTRHHMVAQYHSDSGKIEFVCPLAIQQFDFAGMMVSIRSRFCNLKITPDHRCLVRLPSGNRKIIPASELRSGISIPVSGMYMEGREMNITDDQIRLLVAFAADGSVAKRGCRISFGFSRQRKIKRLCQLLESCGIAFNRQIAKRGDTTIWFDRSHASFLLQNMPDKQWHLGMLQMSFHQRRVALLELSHWDGHENDYGSIKFDTVRKQEADAVSAIAACTGFSCSVNTVSRPQPRQTIYSLSLLERDWKMLGTNNRPGARPGIVQEPYSGKVYCCTVPSGFLLIRRNGKSCVSGNCEGEKDSITAGRFGITATCNVGGAGKWLEAYAPIFQGKDVIIFPDNDPPGRKHGDAILKSLSETANSIKVVLMPEPYKDLTDFIESFPDREQAGRELHALIDRTAHIIKPAPIYSLEEMESAYIEQASRPQQIQYDIGRFLPQLREHIQPMVPGEVMLVLGDTGTGKTMLLQNIVRSASPMPCLLFELELPLSLMFERFVQMETGAFRSDVQQQYRSNPAPRFTDYPGLRHIIVCPESGLTVAEIEKYIVKSELKIGMRPALVAIDYVGLIKSLGKTRYESISNIAEQLKVIAKRTNVIMILASQIARPDKNRESISVGLHDAKDSGSLENSAGVIIGAWRPEQSRMMLKILKNTSGRSGAVIEAEIEGGTMRIRPC